MAAVNCIHYQLLFIKITQMTTFAATVFY